MTRFLVHFAFLLASLAPARAQDLGAIRPVAVPTEGASREPVLLADGDGLFMIWTEDAGGDPRVQVSRLEDGRWSAPGTVAASPGLLVNWADFPSLARFADGTLIAHWLAKTGGAAYAYDVYLAVSRDDGQSWSAPLVPHRDGTASQHGFVTLAPVSDEMLAVWLDGRAYDGDLVEPGATIGAMQLRAAVISPDGTATPDVALDFATCSCCQTDAAMAGETLLVAYRDRTPDEIRDIAVVRLEDGAWSPPVIVHHDGWEISGCPVNGPAIAARGDRVAVAWFTGADDVPAVKIAVSPDAGSSFGAPVRIDRGKPVGRIDMLMLEDDAALVSWIEWDGDDEVLLLCRVTAAGCAKPVEIARNASDASMNFPRLAATPDAVYLAWTQSDGGGRDRVRLARMPR